VKKQYSKQNIIDALPIYEKKISDNISQRRACNDSHIPRKTLEGWKKRKQTIPLDPQIVNFFESPIGFEFLHKILVALQLVLNQIGSCGIRFVTLFMELTKLDYFVASSYEALRKRAVIMENEICTFGDEQRKILSENMPHKKITIAQDETFHPETCLVAMEPVSNYIIAEKYVSNLTADKWNVAMTDGLLGLNVEVIQSTSDEGSSILKHVSDVLIAHHSTDLFHVKYEIHKGINAYVCKLEKVAQKKFDKLTIEVKKSKGKASLNKSLDVQEKRLSEAKSNHYNVKKAQVDIGHAYHPYDIYSGEVNTTEKLAKSLNNSYETIETIADNVNLRQTGKDHIAKSKRMIPAMIDTLKFYFMTINTMLSQMKIPGELLPVMLTILIPISYLTRSLRKAKNAESKNRTLAAIDSLEIQLSNHPVWLMLSNQFKDQLRKLALDCADVFQRSSSCVEGRNGYLSLRHHGLHNISNRKLKVLTVIHNYFIKRCDETTAAERFYEQNHDDLFEYLVQKMPKPGRSRKSLKTLGKAA
jgi:hypothetical protein